MFPPCNAVEGTFQEKSFFAAFKAFQTNTHLSLPIAMKVSEMTDVKSASDAALGPDLIPHRSHRHKQR